MTTPATSFIVSARAGNILSIPGQTHQFTVDPYVSGLVKEDTATDVHEPCVVCGDRASGMFTLFVLIVLI